MCEKMCSLLWLLSDWWYAVAVFDWIITDDIGNVCMRRRSEALPRFSHSAMDGGAWIWVIAFWKNHVNVTTWLYLYKLHMAHTHNRGWRDQSLPLSIAVNWPVAEKHGLLCLCIASEAFVCVRVWAPVCFTCIIIHHLLAKKKSKHSLRKAATKWQRQQSKNGKKGEKKKQPYTSKMFKHNKSLIIKIHPRHKNNQ